jgi:tRNA dimethylallyltransferase
VVVAYQSQVDFPSGLVAAISPARTAGLLEESIAGSNNPRLEELPLVVILLGPTGSGKTALSLALAERFSGEIVSCDSVAVYRGMELGTAKPSIEERARVAHHLIDVTTPDKGFTAGDYSRLARNALKETTARGRMPIVTGGTGLYLRALTEGLFPGPPRQQAIRNRLICSLQDKSANWLHRMLARLDPKSAQRIHANDTPKLIRALEILFTTSQTLSDTLEGRPDRARDPLMGFGLLRIGLNPPREKLYERINTRCAAMFTAGLVEETRGLLAQYGAVKAFDSLGYRQARGVLDGSLSEDEAIKSAQQGHRNYAKRQMTWFRREPDVRWVAGFGDEAGTINTAVDFIENATAR